MGGPVPATLSGGTVVDTAALAALIAAENPVLLDVGPMPHKPDNIAAAAWVPPPHRTIPGSLGYGVAAISRLEGDILAVTAVGGPEELREQLVGRRTPASLILEEFKMADHWGILRFLPHERLSSETAESLWVPELEVSDDPEAWHPLDTLYAPLYSSSGELLGNMSVDLPPHNRIPDQQGRELLEMFVVQAGLALEHAQRREQLSRQVRLGEALKTLAFSVHRDFDGGLRDAARALSEALDAPQVSIRCFPDTVHDPIEHAAGHPDDPRAPALTVSGIRVGLQRRAAEGVLRPFLISLDSDGDDDEAVRVVRAHLGGHGWSSCLLAPVAVDHEVLGYLVVLRTAGLVRDAFRRREGTTLDL
jgi:hypothetical protein